MKSNEMTQDCSLRRRVAGRGSTWLLMLCVVLVRFSPLAAPAAAAETSYSISQAVSSEDASYVREGITLAQNYVAKTLTDISDVPIYVAVFDNDDFVCGEALACTREGAIAVVSGTSRWNSLAPFRRVEAIVHEYIHVYQFAMIHDDMETLPAWFIEGLAEYLAYDAITDLGLVRAQDAYGHLVSDVAWNDDMAALEDLEDSEAFYQADGPTYGLAYLAIAELMKERPLSDLDRFLTDIQRTHNWRTSFVRVFQWDLNGFYRAIEVKREDLTAPVYDSRPFTLLTPQPFESPLQIQSVSGADEAGEQITVLGWSDASAVCRIRLRSDHSGEEEVRSTFADGSGHLFWLITIPESFGQGPATVTANCGGEPVEFHVEIQDAA